MHGGLTFSDFCQEDAETTGICHIPQPGEPERVWWLGMDMAHFMDLIPSMSKRYPHERPEAMETYRDLPYVLAECKSLARQLKSMEPK